MSRIFLTYNFQALNIRWAGQTASEIYNLWRAIGETRGVFTSFSGKRVRLLNVSPVLEVPDDAIRSDHLAGDIAVNKELLKKDRSVMVKCRVSVWGGSLSCITNLPQDSWIKCSLLQFEAKPAIDGLAFANGYLSPQKVQTSQFI